MAMGETQRELLKGDPFQLTPEEKMEAGYQSEPVHMSSGRSHGPVEDMGEAGGTPSVPFGLLPYTNSFASIRNPPFSTLILHVKGQEIIDHLNGKIAELKMMQDNYETKRKEASIARSVRAATGPKNSPAGHLFGADRLADSGDADFFLSLPPATFGRTALLLSFIAKHITPDYTYQLTLADLDTLHWVP